MARLRASQRDWPTALALLDEAERVYMGDFSPPVHPIHATRARVLAASGDLAGATAWARQHGVHADDELSYLREYEHLTLARVLLAQHRVNESGGAAQLTKARELLDRLLLAAEAGGRFGSVIEVEALRARALQALGDQSAALAALEHALRLAEPDRWIRLLIDAGPGLTALLHRVTPRTSAEYVRELLAAATTTARADHRDRSQTDTPTAEIVTPVRTTALADPLSERELDVLKLLGSDLDGPGIARELVISLSTVRTHTKHIYTKLGVNSRRAAVTKGHQLGLLSRPATR
jgi:LuxR family maltose regulon positive regulatory protein